MVVADVNAILAVDGGPERLRAHVVDEHCLRVLDQVEADVPADSARARDALTGLLGRMPRAAAVGHRLSHGGPAVTRPSVVDDLVRGKLADAATVAPEDGPAALALLDHLRDRLPEVPHVVCPDTAFHADLPEAARTYALPEEWRERWGLHRFGGHGLSYAWALRRATELLQRPARELNLLIAHLDDDSSVCAVRDGRSVDTSMGFTGLEGLPMPTRSGSVDPGLLLWLLREDKIGLAELDEALRQRSGLLGLSGGRSATPDELVRAARAGDRRGRLAMDVFSHRVRRELAAMSASLDRIDALVLTGAIGEHQPEVVQEVTAGLGVLGIGSRVPLLIVEAHVELQLAYEAARVAGTASG
ncbi:acetate/propionate family kinase [Prauserella shujinwangii]|uniref:acetate/propionate family kinase n=1 Tax=Prauserella shujinwangii TaxID=1453103 RepID=UPI001FE3910A|nr:acetate kinase [Prauserella shujinwangii]